MSSRCTATRGGANTKGVPLLAPGNRIEHPAPHGDGWTFTQLADLDSDGRLDLLFGTYDGRVYLHRNLGGKPARFEEKGLPLRLADGTPIRVGPAAGQKLDFDVLQGARTTLAAADFTGSGRLDLVVGDTYGKVRYYRNVGTKKEPRFAAPVLLGDLKSRVVPFAADWDGDGWVDVIGSAAGGTVVVFRNRGDGRFAPAEALPVPPVPYGPSVAVVDWNGDGDADLVMGTDYGYFCWFERSFLEHGYAGAARVDRPGRGLNGGAVRQGTPRAAGDRSLPPALSPSFLPRNADIFQPLRINHIAQPLVQRARSPRKLRGHRTAGPARTP